MVQYVITPWQDRQELLMVREQFYGHRQTHRTAQTTKPSPVLSFTGDGDDGYGTEDQEQDRVKTRQRRRDRDREQARAVSHVAMWVHRGGCPHMIESTAQLTAAALADKKGQGRNEDGSGAASSAGEYAARLAYSTAFSRFVTGLLDGQQDKIRKQSMYSLAKTIGLPAAFVELRHQTTHEELPSTPKLRKAAVKAMDWIWEQYWSRLGDDYEPGAECAVEAALLRYVRRWPAGGMSGLRAELTGRWSAEQLSQSLSDLRGRIPPGEQEQTGLSRLMEELSRSEEANADRSEDSPWSLYRGAWTARPIGEV